MTDYKLINQTDDKTTLPQAKSRNALDICAGGLLMKNGRFLFGLRSLNKSWAPGMWDIVGGKAKKGESPKSALERETFEETGIEVIDSILLVEAEVYSNQFQRSLFKYYIYVIADFKGTISNKSEEHSELRWFSPVEIDAVPLALNEYKVIVNSWLLNNSK